MWKVVATEDANAEPVAMFKGEGGTETVVIEFEETIKVYAVDKAGNISDDVILSDESTTNRWYNEKPTIVVEYSLTKEGKWYSSEEELMNNTKNTETVNEIYIRV